mgnify:CR=1 FL=1
MGEQIEITMDTLATYHRSGYSKGRSSARTDLLPILNKALEELNEHTESACECGHCEFVEELRELVSEIKRGR